MITKFYEYIKVNENMMYRKIPTYEEALQIVKANIGFYESKYNIDGYDISIFNYRITPYTEFEKFFHLGSKELRGLTFVKEMNGDIYKRFIMLEKFWNVGENLGNTIEDLKKKKISNIMLKQDGSLISFISLPNGKIIAKTKQGFTNDQCDAANNIYKTNDAIKKFVNYCLNNNIAVMFEYVSFSNRIVLKYDKTDLILIRARNNNTGEYLDIRNLDTPGITLCPFEEKYTNLDEIIDICKTLENAEGFVIQFDDQSMVKQKTDWYFHRHRLVDSIKRENDLIQLILDEKIDDVLSELTNQEEIDFINGIIKVVGKYVVSTSNEVNKLVNDYREIEKRINNAIGVPDDMIIRDKMIKKEFALKYAKDKNFSLAIQVINNKDVYDVVKEHISRNTKDLEDARKWIKNNS